MKKLAVQVPPLERRKVTVWYRATDVKSSRLIASVRSNLWVDLFHVASRGSDSVRSSRRKRQRRHMI